MALYNEDMKNNNYNGVILPEYVAFCLRSILCSRVWLNSG
jgi:hypothetical protein